MFGDQIKKIIVIFFGGTIFFILIAAINRNHPAVKDPKYFFKNFLRTVERNADCYFFSEKKETSHPRSAHTYPLHIPIKIVGHVEADISPAIASGFIVVKQGIFTKDCTVSLIDRKDKHAIPLQYKVMSYWPDGSGKYIHLLTSIPRNIAGALKLAVQIDRRHVHRFQLRKKTCAPLFLVEKIKGMMTIEGVERQLSSRNISRYIWERGPIRFQTFDKKRSAHLEGLFLQTYFPESKLLNLQLTLKCIRPSERLTQSVNQLRWHVIFSSPIEDVAAVPNNEGVFKIQSSSDTIYMYAPWFKELRAWTTIENSGGQLVISFNPLPGQPIEIHTGAGNTIAVSFFQTDFFAANYFPDLLCLGESVSLLPEESSNECLVSYYDENKVSQEAKARLKEIISFYENELRLSPTEYNICLDSQPGPPVSSSFFRRGCFLGKKKEIGCNTDYRQGDLSYYMLLYYYHFKDNDAKKLALDYARYFCDNGAMSHGQGYWLGSVRYYTMLDYSESVYNRFSGILMAYYLTNNYYYYLTSKRIADAGYRRSTRHGELLAIDRSGKIVDTTLSRTPYLAYDYVLAYQTFQEKKFQYVAQRLVDFLAYAKDAAIPYWQMAWNYRLRTWTGFADKKAFWGGLVNYYGYFLEGMYLWLIESDPGTLTSVQIPYLEEAIETEEYYRVFPIPDLRWALSYTRYYKSSGDARYKEAARDSVEAFLSQKIDEFNNQQVKECLLLLPILSQWCEETR